MLAHYTVKIILVLFFLSHFLFILFLSLVFITLLSILFSPGGAGRSFNPRSLCEVALLEHTRRRLPLPAANPAHTSRPVNPRLPTGRSVQGACPCLCPGEVVPALVSCWAWPGPPARLEQDWRLWPGGVGSHSCHRWVEYELQSLFRFLASQYSGCTVHVSTGHNSPFVFLFFILLVKYLSFSCFPLHLSFHCFCGIKASSTEKENTKKLSGSWTSTNKGFVFFSQE